MLMSSGYYRLDTDILLDTQKNICLNSVGHYRLRTVPFFSTVRSKGREDMHIIYVASGTLFMDFGQGAVEVKTGEIAVCYPNEPHSYHYYQKDYPDIYWLHFSGKNAEELMREAGFAQSGSWRVRVRNRYVELFERMITELQLKRSNFLEVASSYLVQLIFFFSRSLNSGNEAISPQTQIVEKVMHSFHTDYSQSFLVKELAAEHGISTCWLIKCFKEHTGQTPLEYLTHVRIRSGQELLENSGLPIATIAEMVGYSNPFYFSRQFKAVVGVSPSEYKKAI